MNDYKELIEELRAHCICITDGDNCGNCEGLISEKAYCHLQIKLHKKAADAIEQLVRERDAAIADAKEFGGCRSCLHHSDLGDCIGALLNNDCWEWRGVQK